MHLYDTFDDNLLKSMEKLYTCISYRFRSISKVPLWYLYWFIDLLDGMSSKDPQLTPIHHHSSITFCTIHILWSCCQWCVKNNLRVLVSYLLSVPIILGVFRKHHTIKLLKNATEFWNIIFWNIHGVRVTHILEVCTLLLGLLQWFLLATCKEQSKAWCQNDIEIFKRSTNSAKYMQGVLCGTCPGKVCILLGKNINL